MRGQRVARCGEPLSVLEQQGGFALLTGDGPVLVLVGGLLTGWRGLPKAQCDGGVVERYEFGGWGVVVRRSAPVESSPMAVSRSKAPVEAA